MGTAKPSGAWTGAARVAARRPRDPRAQSAPLSAVGLLGAPTNPKGERPELVESTGAKNGRPNHAHQAAAVIGSVASSCCSLVCPSQFIAPLIGSDHRPAKLSCPSWRPIKFEFRHPKTAIVFVSNLCPSVCCCCCCCCCCILRPQQQQRKHCGR